MIPVQPPVFLLVRPAYFDDDKQVHALVLQEFDEMVHVLRKHDIELLIIPDTALPQKQDALFLNNWITFHEQGQVVLYPLQNVERRVERRQDILSLLETKFVIKQYHHFEQYEASNRFLEGAGSIVFDRKNKVAYACSSPKTDATLLDKWCDSMGYQAASFRATDRDGIAMSHTSFVLAIAENYVVVCLEAVNDGADKLLLKQFLRSTHKDIIEITIDQMHHFAGNILQVVSKSRIKYLVMSSQAKKSLSPEQISKITAYNAIININIPTIEKHSGGSVQSVIAEIYL